MILPRPTASTWTVTPWPPPVTVTVSFSLYKLPSLVSVCVAGIPVTAALIKLSSVSNFVPLIVSLISKVPKIVSSFNINSETSVAPICNLFTCSIMAVAPDVSPVIVLPTKSKVSPAEASALNIFWVSHLPSDTLNIFSLG